MNPSAPADTPSDREIVLSREFAAPRELVWDAMASPEHVVNWWGPRGFTTTIEVMDVRPGGTWKHTMHGPDGVAYPNLSTFQEVVRPERIVYAHGGSRDGGPEIGFVATWTFEALAASRTRVTIRMVFASAAGREFVEREFGAIEGGRQTLERLGEHLAARRAQPFVITREFSAPRALVWRAWTEREQLLQWFGPKGFTMTTSTQDLRPGGKFHYSMRTPDGVEMWGRFLYREIVEPSRLVWVNSFSDPSGGITRHPFSSDPWPLQMLTTVIFVEHAGRTTVTVTWLPLDAPDDEVRTFEANHPSMTRGWGGTMDQFETHLAGTATSR